VTARGRDGLGRGTGSAPIKLGGGAGRVGRRHLGRPQTLSEREMNRRVFVTVKRTWAIWSICMAENTREKRNDWNYELILL
jgi:hypothetical protein